MTSEYSRSMAILFTHLLAFLHLGEVYPVQCCVYPSENDKYPKQNSQHSVIQYGEKSPHMAPGELTVVPRETSIDPKTWNQSPMTKSSKSNRESKIGYLGKLRRKMGLRLKTPDQRLVQKRCQELMQAMKCCRHCKRPKRPRSIGPFPKGFSSRTEGFPDPPREKSPPVTPYYGPHANPMGYASRPDDYTPSRINGRPNPMAGRTSQELLDNPKYKHYGMAGLEAVMKAQHRPHGHHMHGGHGGEEEEGEEEQQAQDPGYYPYPEDMLLPGVPPVDPAPVAQLQQDVLNPALSGNCDCGQLLQDAANACLKVLQEFLANFSCRGCACEEGWNCCDSGASSGVDYSGGYGGGADYGWGGDYGGGGGGGGGGGDY